MEDTEVVLLLKYPLISKHLEGNSTIYSGSIHVNDEDHKIHITESKGDYKIRLHGNLSVFSNELDILISKSQHKNVITVVDNVSTFIDSKTSSSKVVDYSEIYRHVLYEYFDFTRFYLNVKSSCLASDLTKINISTVDEGNREHSLEVSIDFSDKDLFSVTFYDLPQDRTVFKKSASLKDVYDQFLATIASFQLFFDTVDVFDKNCWVLDPELPNKSAGYRRIWMGENFSVVITFDPSDVSRLPEIKFLGPERLVEQFRAILNCNIADWEPENGIFPEVLKLLGLDNFPQKPTDVEHVPDLLMEAGDCSICFALRLNEKIPEVVCKNKSCENCYHAECLYEWLMSVNARRFFSEVVGLCPNCEKNISCPIPK